MGSLTVTKVAVGWDVLITGEAVHVRDTGHLGNLHFCTIFGEPTSALINEVFFFFSDLLLICYIGYLSFYY